MQACGGVCNVKTFAMTELILDIILRIARIKNPKRIWKENKDGTITGSQNPKPATGTIEFLPRKNEKP